MILIDNDHLIRPIHSHYEIYLSEIAAIMIYGQLSGRSPEKAIHRDVGRENLPGLAYLTCMQLKETSLRYDEVRYQGKVIDRVVVVGIIVSSEQVTSPRGMAMINLTLKDESAYITIGFYRNKTIEELSKRKGIYVRVGLNVKCGGLPYRP